MKAQIEQHITPVMSNTSAPAYKTVQFLCKDTCTIHVIVVLSGRTSQLTTDSKLKLWALPSLKFDEIYVHNAMFNLSCRFLHKVFSIRISNSSVWFSNWLLMENFSHNWHARIFFETELPKPEIIKFRTSLLYILLFSYITCCHQLSHLTKFLLITCCYYQVQQISIENARKK